MEALVSPGRFPELGRRAGHSPASAGINLKLQVGATTPGLPRGRVSVVSGPINGMSLLEQNFRFLIPRRRTGSANQSASVEEESRKCPNRPFPSEQLPRRLAAQDRACIT